MPHTRKTLKQVPFKKNAGGCKMVQSSWDGSLANGLMSIQRAFLCTHLYKRTHLHTYMLSPGTHVHHLRSHIPHKCQLIQTCSVYAYPHPYTKHVDPCTHKIIHTLTPNSPTFIHRDTHTILSRALTKTVHTFSYTLAQTSLHPHTRTHVHPLIHTHTHTHINTHTHT